MIFDRFDAIVIICSLILLGVITISIPLLCTDITISDIEHHYDLKED